MIATAHLTYSYPERPPLLHNITVSIPNGSSVALMGKNGSGKTTLALLLKGLLTPLSGDVIVDGFNSNDPDSQLEVMKRVGIVFQNPDTSMVATTVERELAFGLENLSIPHEEMRERVTETLEHFHLESYRYMNPSLLSGGEKQRVALAGVMIMRPLHLILDEPTSLLDPEGRDILLKTIETLISQGTTIVHITPFESDAYLADRVIVLEEGEITLDGSPGEVLTQKRIARSGRIGFPIGTNCVLSNVPLIAGLQNVQSMRDDSPLVTLNNICHIYNARTSLEKKALDGITIAFHRGSSTVLFGPSGSGKTTLLEIVEGITSPTTGTVECPKNLIRAMAFQFPEDELFGDTVESYISFGLENINTPIEKRHDSIVRSLTHVGLVPNLYIGRDPLTLSAGEKRRVALAGVLAMNPGMLILDEPDAGLDIEGVETMLSSLREYLQEGGTLLFSTHDFDVASQIARGVIVLVDGRVETQGELSLVLQQSRWIAALKENFISPLSHRKV